MIGNALERRPPETPEQTNDYYNQNRTSKLFKDTRKYQVASSARNRKHPQVCNPTHHRNSQSPPEFQSRHSYELTHPDAQHAHNRGLRDILRRRHRAGMFGTFTAHVPARGVRNVPEHVWNTAPNGTQSIKVLTHLGEKPVWIWDMRVV